MIGFLEKKKSRIENRKCLGVLAILTRVFRKALIVMVVTSE